MVDFKMKGQMMGINELTPAAKEARESVAQYEGGTVCVPGEGTVSSKQRLSAHSSCLPSHQCVLSAFLGIPSHTYVFTNSLAGVSKQINSYCL